MQLAIQHAFAGQNVNVKHSWSAAHLGYFLLVVNYQQWYRKQDGSETLDSFLKPPGCGQLVTLLQAGDEVGEAQTHSRQPLLCPRVLKKKERKTKRVYFSIFTFTKKTEKQEEMQAKRQFFIINQTTELNYCKFY